jgi:membrane protein implicated in regulation of membrane protease activity
MELTLIDILNGFDIWHWWIAAIILGVIEMIIPGVLFLWLAIAAAIVGFMKLAMPGLSWEMQWIAFAILSVISTVAGRAIYQRTSDRLDDHPRLNQRSAQYIGRTLTLMEPVSNKTSRAMVDDSTWAVRCDESLPVGSQVVVKDVDGIILIVAAAELAEQDDAINVDDDGEG